MEIADCFADVPGVMWRRCIVFCWYFWEFFFFFLSVETKIIVGGSSNCQFCFVLLDYTCKKAKHFIRLFYIPTYRMALLIVYFQNAYVLSVNVRDPTTL
jgi:hypothetical protein